MFAYQEIAGALLLAMAIDRLIGDPDWLYRYLPHPVVVIGAGISRLERRFYWAGATADHLGRSGRIVIVMLVLSSLAIGMAIQWFCLLLPFGWVPLGILMSTLLAQKSLADHVLAVAAGLDQGLDQGRAAVARIVGRDPEQLDRHGVARSAIESLAENFSDGVAAPVFWALCLGLPGMLAYKAINTADSMIGHKSERYLHFGRAAARLDDAVNWLPARISAFVILAASWFLPGARWRQAWRAIRRGANRHRSPSAGWPEAALAGALGFRLAGPRRYDGEMTEDAWIGEGNAELDADDIRKALRLFWWSCGILAVLILGLVLV